MTASGWRNNTHFDDQDFLVTEPGLYFDSAVESPFNGSFRLTLGNSTTSDTNDLTFTIPHEELTRPVRGLVRNGTRQVNTSVTELAVFNQSAWLDAAVLGQSLLHCCFRHASTKRFRLLVLGKVFLSRVGHTDSSGPFACTHFLTD